MKTTLLKILCWIPLLGLIAGHKLEKQGKFYDSKSFMFAAIGKYQALCITAVLGIAFFKLSQIK